MAYVASGDATSTCYTICCTIICYKKTNPRMNLVFKYAILCLCLWSSRGRGEDQPAAAQQQYYLPRQQPEEHTCCTYPSSTQESHSHTTPYHPS